MLGLYKSLEVLIDYISHSSFFHWCPYSIIEGYQIGRAQSALGEAILAVSDHLLSCSIPIMCLIP